MAAMTATCRVIYFFTMADMTAIFGLPGTVGIGIFFKFCQAMITAEIIGCAFIFVFGKGRLIFRTHAANRVGKNSRRVLIVAAAALLTAMIVLVIMNCVCHDAPLLFIG